MSRRSGGSVQPLKEIEVAVIGDFKTCIMLTVQCQSICLMLCKLYYVQHIHFYTSIIIQEEIRIYNVLRCVCVCLVHIIWY